MLAGTFPIVLKAEAELLGITVIATSEDQLRVFLGDARDRGCGWRVNGDCDYLEVSPSVGVLDVAGSVTMAGVVALGALRGGWIVAASVTVSLTSVLK